MVFPRVPYTRYPRFTLLVVTVTFVLPWVGKTKEMEITSQRGQNTVPRGFKSSSRPVALKQDLNLSYTGFGSDAAAAGMKRALAAGARRPLLVAQGSLPAGNRAEVS
jgi:hypothetical protein